LAITKKKRRQEQGQKKKKHGLKGKVEHPTNEAGKNKSSSKSRHGRRQSRRKPRFPLQPGVTKDEPDKKKKRGQSHVSKTSKSLVSHKEKRTM